ncbi:MAG: hypothetical protein U0234_16795 [Sandaracinus sp.]
MGNRALGSALLTVAAAAIATCAVWLAPAPAPAQVDAGVDGGSAPAIPGIADKMGRRLLSSLRETHHAMPHVLAADHVTQPDGGEDVVLLYEYADYDACVGAAPTKQAGREQCRDRLGAGGSCTHREVVRATIGATPAGRPPGTGGAITVAGTHEEPGACLLDHVVQLARRDVDGDSRAEILVDLVTIEHPRDYRTATLMDVRRRHASILREDLTPEIELELGHWGQDNVESSTTSEAARWSLAQPRGGVPTVRVESFEYEDAGGCQPDAEGWLTPDDPDEEAECSGTVETELHPYVAASDSFP